MKRFAVAALWSFLGAVASRLVTLGGNVLAARQLGPSGFGRLGVVTSTAALFTTAASLGLGLAVSRFIAQQRSASPERVARTLRCALTSAAVAGGLIGLAILAASNWFASYVLGSVALATPLRICAPWVALGAISAVQTGLLAGLEEFRQLALLNSVRGLSSGLLLWGGSRFWGVEGGIAGLAIAEILGLYAGRVLVASALGRHAIPEDVRDWQADLGPLLRFSLPSLLASAAIAPALWFGRLLLVRSPEGFVQAGLFEAANKWALAILFVPAAIGTVQVPMLSNFIANGDRAIYRRIILLNLGVAAASCLVPGLGVAFFAGRILSLSGHSFASGSQTLAVLAISTMAVAANGTLGASLLSRGEVWTRLGADWVLAGLLIGVSWFLVPRVGALGFAWAHAVAYSFASLGLLIVEFRALRGSLQEWS